MVGVGEWYNSCYSYCNIFKFSIKKLNYFLINGICSRLHHAHFYIRFVKFPSYNILWMKYYIIFFMFNKKQFNNRMLVKQPLINDLSYV